MIHFEFIFFATFIGSLAAIIFEIVKSYRQAKSSYGNLTTPDILWSEKWPFIVLVILFLFCVYFFVYIRHDIAKIKASNANNTRPESTTIERVMTDQLEVIAIERDKIKALEEVEKRLEETEQKSLERAEELTQDPE